MATAKWDLELGAEAARERQATECFERHRELFALRRITANARREERQAAFRAELDAALAGTLHQMIDLVPDDVLLSLLPNQGGA